MYVNHDIDYLKFLKDKKIFIFGAGTNGKKCCVKLEKYGYEVICFIDNNTTKYNEVYEGKRVIDVKKYLELKDEKAMIIICSGRFEREIKEQLLNRGIYNFISEHQIDFGGGEEYYDEEYFAFQKSMGEFGGRIKSSYFKEYTNKETVLVEFGSGGGYLLKELEAREKVGVEINDVARKNAEEQGIKSVKTIAELPDNYADVIISTSVLEHVENPIGVLKELRNKLKDDGKIVFHVPNESCDTEYTKSEINNHLFTWNCLNIGNLFKAAGYFVCSVKLVKDMWPVNFQKIEEEVSRELLSTICLINGVANDNNSCIIVAKK